MTGIGSIICKVDVYKRQGLQTSFFVWPEKNYHTSHAQYRKKIGPKIFGQKPETLLAEDVYKRQTTKWTAASGSPHRKPEKTSVPTALQRNF